MSSGIAALVAHVTFWILLAYGWFWEEFGLSGAAVFLALWAIGWLGLPYVAHAIPFYSYVAVLDIVLVFMIFKGDVRLT